VAKRIVNVPELAKLAISLGDNRIVIRVRTEGVTPPASLVSRQSDDAPRRTEDLMLKKVNTEQRQQILHLLAQGQDRDTIAAAIGVTPGQVSAVSAHVKMGTYKLPEPRESDAAPLRKSSILSRVERLDAAKSSDSRLEPILLGADVETGEPVYWNPDQASGTPNPHVLIIGESGTGKTYTTSCLVAELAQEGITTIIFDYGQGFAAQSLPEEFVSATQVEELHASRDGVDINPLQVFATDIHGPINVAQRVADTFGRVYSKIGIQQHAAIRQAVLDVMTDAGIRSEEAMSWRQAPPPFVAIHDKLNSYAADITHPQSRYAGTAASHISTLFVFNTFRPNGKALAWRELLASRNGPRTIVIQLSGLEHSLEKAASAFA
jgi:hypothetical protein